MLVRILDKAIIRNDTGLTLDGAPVGVAMLDIVFSRKEMQRAFETTQYIWKRLYSLSDNKNQLVHSRFDLVLRAPGSLRPKKTTFHGRTYYDLGQATVVSIYEPNLHAAECAAALDAMFASVNWKYGNLRFNSRSKMVGHAFGKHIGHTPLMYVQSTTKSVKRNWGNIFYNGLRSGGLNLTPRNERHIMNHSGGVYRFGDARLNGETEFSPKFTKHLYERSGLIVNSLPGKRDVSGKDFLMPYGDSRWDSLVGRNHMLNGPMSILKSFPPSNWVKKPIRGASGSDIDFGKDFNWLTWPLKLWTSSNLNSTKYGMYKACWAQQIRLPGHAPIAADFNISTLINGPNMQYLYSLMRMDWWDRYWKRGTINVSTGAGIGLSVRVV